MLPSQLECRFRYIQGQPISSQHILILCTFYQVCAPPLQQFHSLTFYREWTSGLVLGELKYNNVDLALLPNAVNRLIIKKQVLLAIEIFTGSGSVL